MRGDVVNVQVYEDGAAGQYWGPKRSRDEDLVYLRWDGERCLWGG